MKWKSLHIFCHDFKQQDQIIKYLYEFSKKLINDNIIKKWFFIRYWDGGPHIRYRIELIETEVDKNYLEELYEYIHDFNFINTVNKEEYYKNHSFDGQEVDWNSLNWFENGEIVTMIYEPENDRYGGLDVIKYSEDLFYYSSELSSILIEKFDNISKRILCAYVVTNKIIKGVLSSFHKIYIIENIKTTISYWNQFSVFDDKIENFYLNNDKFINYLKSDDDLQIIIEKFINQINLKLENIKEHVIDDEYLVSIVFSHLHMLNNRLGVTPIYERIAYKYILKEIEND